MGKYYKILVLKPDREKKSGVKEENFRGTNRFLDPGNWFQASPKIENLNERKMKKFIRKKLSSLPKQSFNNDYDITEKETVKMISEGKGNPVIFKGRIKMPDSVRDDKKQRQKRTKIGDMR